MIPNCRLILPYFGPYLAYVFIASFFGGFISPEGNYILRIIFVTLSIVWAWKWYFPLRGPKSPLVSVVLGLGAGILGVSLWIFLLSPFVQQEAGTPWSENFFVLKLISAGLLVPVFEEILMRGFILRFAVQWYGAKREHLLDPLKIALHERSVDNVEPGDWSWPAVAISIAAFTMGHRVQEWPASMAFGLLMVSLWIFRKDLIACIVAHSCTNIALAVYVFRTGRWNLW